ncbi:MAG: beta strand repeat-containing protein [Alcanivorax sp.]|uniref:beta strand repeat-containing protein n=1 Tax=Alcanivorax sp. TaxID=1872427 RepID=UPI003DA6D2AC
MKLAFQKGLLSARVSASAMGLGLVLAAGQTLALTPAGTDINNRATVTYEDANGNSYSAQSNESTVTVAEVYAATLENDGSKSGAPGETVYFTHTLTNTGNADDSFSVDGLAGLDAATGASTYTVYLDANGNGVPDAGEAAVNTVNLNAGQQAELIVAVPVPAGAGAGDTIESTLLVESVGGGAGTVEDIGANGDAATYDADGDSTPDGNDTNNNVVTVTTDAVLQLSKTAVPNFNDNTITYTLEVKNNGGRAAQDVDIFDPIPANATFAEIVSVNGLLTSSGDQWLDSTGALQALPHSYAGIADLADVTEPAGVDLDGNGTTGETLKGINFRDAIMGVNTTVTVVYKVDFDGTLASGTQIRNTFAAEGDLDGDNIPDDPSTSNTTTTTIQQVYAVDATDTGDAADADATLNDIALQDEANSGAVVAFANIVANNGNGSDVFDLSIGNDAGAGYAGAGTVPAGAQSYPAGTLFTFWNATNNTQLTDTNGNGVPDTGSIAAGADRRITVRAQLPAGVSGTGPFVATMVATSFGDNSVSDDKLKVLTEIVAPAVDLANSHSADLTDAVIDADAFNAAAPTTTTEVAVGGIATFPLFVANNSGNAQSFTLGADLPAGWAVTFREVGVDTDADGTADNTSNAGNVVTATPSLPAGAVYQYQADVQVSSNVAQAAADFTGAGTVNTNDSDGDYPIRFTVVSSSDGTITDQKLDAVDVIANRNITVSPDGANQVQPGGNVDYTHVIANGGNTTEAVEIAAANSLAADGWNNNTQLFIDTTGNGTPDAWVQLDNLPTANDVAVRTPNGNTILVDINNAGANPLVTLEPGQRLDVRVTVFAPSNAPAGTVDSYTLTASNANVSDTATDTTEVVVGQVRLDKQAAIDTACDCAGGTWPAGGFEPVQSNQVEPGQCVVWQLTATNEGATTAENVVITDETTEFTTFQAADDAVRASDSATTANTGTLPVVEWEIGQLVSGDSARTQFCVEVN